MQLKACEVRMNSASKIGLVHECYCASPSWYKALMFCAIGFAIVAAWRIPLWGDKPNQVYGAVRIEGVVESIRCKNVKSDTRVYMWVKPVAGEELDIVQGAVTCEELPIDSSVRKPFVAYLRWGRPISIVAGEHSLVSFSHEKEDWWLNAILIGFVPVFSLTLPFVACVWRGGKWK